MAGPQPYSPNQKRGSAGGAAVQVLIVAALVGGAIFFYATRQRDTKRVMETAHAAEEKTLGDDAPALLEARKKLAEIPQDKLEANDKILATAAEIEAVLFQAYGMADAKPKAEHYTQLLKDRNVRDAKRYAAEAYLLLGSGKAAEAEQMLMDLINNKGARHAKLLHALSVAKLAEGKAKEAVVAAQEGEKLSTQLVRLPIAEGDALLALGNIPSAASAYLKATKLNADHVRARTALALTAAISRQGKPELLIKSLDNLQEEAKQKMGGEPPPRVTGFIQYAKGEIFLSANDAKNALAMADESIKTDPSQPSTFALKGRALAKLGKIDEAKKAFDDALALSPSSLPIAQAANDVFARAKREKEGVAYLAKVQTANPENGMAYVDLSLAQSRAGMAKEALKNADLAIQKLGNAFDLAVFAKGRAQLADNKLEEARKTFADALGDHQAGQDWPELWFAMGELRNQEKNYDDAAQMFQKAIELWDKQGAPIDTVADAYEAMAKSYDAQGKKKHKEAQDAQQKADELRNPKKA